VSGEVFDVRVPNAAVAGDTIDEPTVKLLRALNLLPSKADMGKGSRPWAAITGPPESVALIEAGATAATKWWATGLGASVVSAWGAVRTWWSGEETGNQHIALWVAGIVTAAALLGIAYLLAADIRGRAAAATETIRARATVADAFVRMAESAHSRLPPAAVNGDSQLRFAALPQAVNVKYHLKAGPDEDGWRAIAVLTDGEQSTRYLVVKGTNGEWANGASLEFC
jgi:hypothetical protein